VLKNKIKLIEILLIIKKKTKIAELD